MTAYCVHYLNISKCRVHGIGGTHTHLSPLKKYVLPTSSQLTAVSMLWEGISLANCVMSFG